MLSDVQRGGNQTGTAASARAQLRLRFDREDRVRSVEAELRFVVGSCTLGIYKAKYKRAFTHAQGATKFSLS